LALLVLYLVNTGVIREDIDSFVVVWPKWSWSWSWSYRRSCDRLLAAAMATCFALFCSALLFCWAHAHIKQIKRT